MAETYIVFNNQGRRRSIDAESMAEVRSQFQRVYPEEYSQGIVIQNRATGEESYISSDYMTNDPETVARIREQGMDVSAIIGAAPTVARNVVFDNQGQRITVDAESMEGVRSQFREFYPEEYSQGIVIRNTETGEENYVSPGYVTSDPEAVARIREQGMDVSEAATDFWQRAILGEDPALARGAAMMGGVPVLRGWYDELLGAMYGPQAASGTRFAEEAMAEQRPLETLGLQLGTGIATTLPFAAATSPASATSVGATALQGGVLGGLLGAAEGAAAGAGYGEDPTARMYSAQQQALTGGMFGGALGAAAPLAGAAVGGTYNTLVGNPALDRLARSLGLSPEAARTAASSTAFEAGMPPPAPSSIPLSLAETSPQARTGLDVAMGIATPGSTQARFMLDEQAGEASRRIDGLLDEYLGEPRGPAIREAEMRADTTAARREAYDTAYAAPIDYASEQGDRLLQLLDRVDPDIINRANTLMRREGLQSNQIRVQLDEAGNIIGTEQLPDVMQIDYITRALQSRARAMGVEPEDVRTLTAQLVDIRGTLDDLVPEYAAARSQAAELLGNVEALEVGYGALLTGTRRDILQQQLDGMTPGEMENVRAGMRDYLQEMMGRASRPLDENAQEVQEAVAALRQLTTSNAQEKLRMILGDEADEFIQRLQENIGPLSVRTVGGGSPTAPRQSAIATAQEIAQPGPIEQAARNPTGIPGQVTGLLAAGAPSEREIMRNIQSELAPFFATQRPADELAALRDYLSRVPAAAELPTQILRGATSGGYQVGLGLQPALTQEAQRRGLAQRPVRSFNPQ
jgi:post-segregation antitoxin (ccd killing protein)